MPTTEYCSYCDEDIVVGQEVRRHHRGGLIHEHCYQERSQSRSFKPEFYASSPEVFDN